MGRRKAHDRVETMGGRLKSREPEAKNWIKGVAETVWFEVYSVYSWYGVSQKVYSYWDTADTTGMREKKGLGVSTGV